MKSLPIVVKIPQLDRFGYSDYISISLAIIAVIAIIGSVWISKRQMNLAIRQMNREERKKLYLPVLAMMAAEWAKFDHRMISVAIPNFSSELLETEENLEALKAKIQSYEFEMEEELVGSKKVSEAIDTWFEKLQTCVNLFEEYQSEHLKSNLLPANAGPEWKAKRDSVYRDLVAQSDELKSGVKSIVDLVRNEINMTKRRRWLESWGTAGAQDKKSV